MVKIRDIICGGGNPLVLIAGPCVIENRDITYNTAERIKEISQKLKVPFVFKSSFKKANRTKLKNLRKRGEIT